MIEKLFALLTATVTNIVLGLGIHPPWATTSFENPPNQPIEFIVFGDSGKGDEGQQTLAQVMATYPFTFILHTGDVAYEAGTREQIQTRFFDVYQNSLSRATFYPSPGNHDYQTENLAPYLEAFRVDHYYAFQQGSAHFISLDTNASLTEGSMVNWLADELEKIPSSDWKIVYFHHPPYSSGEQHGDNRVVQEKLVPLFNRYEVDLVFSGHEHTYERFAPRRGVTYIITGGGSGHLYGFGSLHPDSLIHESQTHFVHVTVDQCRLTGKAINVNNQVFDTFALTKCSE